MQRCLLLLLLLELGLFRCFVLTRGSLVFVFVLSADAGVTLTVWNPWWLRAVACKNKKKRGNLIIEDYLSRS